MVRPASLYFLHIPKTAGSSLSKVLQGGYRPESRLPAHEWQGLVGLDRHSINRHDYFAGQFGTREARRRACSSRSCVLLSPAPTGSSRSTWPSDGAQGESSPSRWRELLKHRGRGGCAERTPAHAAIRPGTGG